MKRTTRLVSLVLAVILCLSVLPLNAAAASNGWVKDSDGYWFYYENGSPVTGWKKIGGSWYYFIPDFGGRMCVGWMNSDPEFYSVTKFRYSGDWYHFNDSGAMDANKWFKSVYELAGGGVSITWSYCLSDGKRAIGWHKIGGVWYYFDPFFQGEMVAGEEYFIDGKWYYFKDNGALYTGWKQLTRGDDYGNLHTFWAYFTSAGAVQDAWKNIDGKWYYFSDLEMLTGGPYSIDGKLYYFKDSGALYTGWKYVQFTDEDGMAGWSAWAYFTSSGAVTGWKKIDGKWYYFRDNGEMFVGWLNTDPTYFTNKHGTSGDWYHFGESGAMDAGKWIRQTDYFAAKTSWYYFLSSGKQAMGWLKTGGKWYYLDPEDGGAMVTGMKIIDGVMYYFEENGALSS